MVYDSDFYTTRRTYSRPVVTSYSVSYPIRITTPVISKVYTSTYPIYSYNPLPYVVKHSYGTTRVRVVSSPIRIVHSPARYIRTSVTPIRTIRSFVSPVRTTTIRSVVSPVRGYSTERIVTTPPRTVYTSYTRPSVYLREYDRILNRPRPRVGYSPLENYLNSETYINFDDEARKIRSSAQSLLREIHTTVPRSIRSMTPFPVSRYEPVTPYALEAYIARIKNPLRHVVKEIHAINNFQEASVPRPYFGKSHLASVRIVGNRAYNIRNPFYSPDKVRNNIEYLSHYLRNRRLSKEYKQKENNTIEAIEATDAKVNDDQ